MPESAGLVGGLDRPARLPGEGDDYHRRLTRLVSDPVPGEVEGVFPADPEPGVPVERQCRRLAGETRVAAPHKDNMADAGFPQPLDRRRRLARQLEPIADHGGDRRDLPLHHAAVILLSWLRGQRGAWQLSLRIAGAQALGDPGAAEQAQRAAGT